MKNIVKKQKFTPNYILVWGAQMTFEREFNSVGCAIKNNMSPYDILSAVVSLLYCKELIRYKEVLLSIERTEIKLISKL